MSKLSMIDRLYLGLAICYILMGTAYDWWLEPLRLVFFVGLTVIYILFC